MTLIRIAREPSKDGEKTDGNDVYVLLLVLPYVKRGKTHKSVTSIEADILNM